jgi:hypothetical protein
VTTGFFEAELPCPPSNRTRGGPVGRRTNEVRVTEAAGDTPVCHRGFSDAALVHSWTRLAGNGAGYLFAILDVCCRRRSQKMAGGICPTCGYPTLGSRKCAACLPVVALEEDEPTLRNELASATAAANLLWPVSDRASAQTA